MAPHLPLELYDRILDFLHDDLATLRVCGLTCRALLPTARYHRFEKIRITWRSYKLFCDILNTSPDLGRFITTLELCNVHQLSSGWQGEHDAFAFFAQLPVVEELRMINISVHETLHVALSDHFQSVKRLSLSRCKYEADARGFLASFPALEELWMEQVRWNWPGNHGAPTALPLRTLHILDLAEDCRPIVKWLSSSAHKTLDTLEFCIHEAADVVPLNGVLLHIGQNLKHLEISISAWWDLDSQSLY